MKIHADIEQGSMEWDYLRAGKVTASEMDALVTPLGKVRTGDGPYTYLMKKVAERWLQGPIPNPKKDAVWDLEQGHILEEYARPAFTIETGIVTQRVGFVTDDKEVVGCSPDGLIGNYSGLELKCPHIAKHIEYLLAGEVPSDYVAQVQTSMFVTGYDHWYFASFRRGFPMLILKVERDEKYQAAILQAVESFFKSLKESWDVLLTINGGPPPPRKRFVPSSPDDPRKELFTGTHDDDVPH